MKYVTGFQGVFRYLVSLLFQDHELTIGGGFFADYLVEISAIIKASCSDTVVGIRLLSHYKSSILVVQLNPYRSGSFPCLEDHRFVGWIWINIAFHVRFLFVDGTDMGI